MLCAGKLIFQFRHLLLGRIQNAAVFVRKTHISGGSVDFWATLQLRAQSVPQLIYICSNFLEERPRYALALIQESGKKMFIGNFRMVSLRSDVLRSLQRLLHLLCVFIDAHDSKDSERNPQRQSRAIVIPSEARNLTVGAWIMQVSCVLNDFWGGPSLRSG